MDDLFLASYSFRKQMIFLSSSIRFHYSEAGLQSLRAIPIKPGGKDSFHAHSGEDLEADFAQKCAASLPSRFTIETAKELNILLRSMSLAENS
jgi:hypothetical protein